MPHVIAPDTSTAAARRSMREQIARLERELSHTLATTYPYVTAARPIAHHGPRLLGLAELERTRDALAARVSDTRRRAAAQAAKQAEARATLDRMLADPHSYKGATIANADLGLPGCTTYAVRPRLGLFGVLGGWWRVKVSSGCPLPGL